MSRGVGCCRVYLSTISLSLSLYLSVSLFLPLFCWKSGSRRRNEIEQPRDRTRRVGSNKRQIYSSELRGMREESKYKQARQQASRQRNVTYSGSRPWLYWSRRGGTAVASYASISVVAPVLASSRFRENPRSFGPFFHGGLPFFGSLCETFEFLQLGTDHHHCRQTDTRRAANLPSWDSWKPHRVPGIHSFSNLSPRRLPRSWITGLSLFFSFYFFSLFFFFFFFFFFFVRPLFFSSLLPFRRIRDLVDCIASPIARKYADSKHRIICRFVSI